MCIPKRRQNKQNSQDTSQILLNSSKYSSGEKSVIYHCPFALVFDNRHLAYTKIEHYDINIQRTIFLQILYQFVVFFLIVVLLFIFATSSVNKDECILSKGRKFVRHHVAIKKRPESFDPLLLAFEFRHDASTCCR